MIKLGCLAMLKGRKLICFMNTLALLKSSSKRILSLEYRVKKNPAFPLNDNKKERPGYSSEV
jgi:hypothetical protein